MDCPIHGLNGDFDQTTSSCIRILYAATVAACFFFVRVASPCLYSPISPSLFWTSELKLTILSHLYCVRLQLPSTYQPPVVHMYTQAYPPL